MSTPPGQPSTPLKQQPIGQNQLEERIEAVRQAADRSRLARFISLLAAGAMFICLWNTYASWDRDFAFLDKVEDFKAIQVFISGMSKSETTEIIKQIAHDSKVLEKGESLNSALSGKPIDLQVLEAKKKEIARSAWNSCKQCKACMNLDDCRLHQVDESKIYDEIINGSQLFDAYGRPIDSRDVIALAWNNHTKELPPYLHDQQMRSWIDTQVVSVTLLGIKISVSDFAFLGSIALFIFAYYVLLCSRRENHEIGHLFHDVNASDQMNDQGYHAFAMVSSFMVLNLSGAHSGQSDVAIGRDNWQDGEKRDIKAKERYRWYRWVSSALFFFPPFTVLITIICDLGWKFIDRLPFLGNAFFTSAFRPLVTASATSFWHDYGYMVFADGTALLVFGVLLKISLRVRMYEHGTREILDAVYDKLVNPRNPVIRKRWPGTTGAV